MNGALVDTSFLITLSQPTRPNHRIAKLYFMEMIKRAVPMYLSTIVISEYEVRQRVADLVLSNFIILPFNIDHAIAAGSLTDMALADKSDDYRRDTIKDDVKLLAQCELGGISLFITNDGKCVNRINRLRKTYPRRAVPIGVYCGNQFDVTWFDSQNALPFDQPVSA